MLLLLPYIAPLVIALLIRFKSPLGPVAHAMTQLSLTPTLITGPQKDNGELYCTVYRLTPAVACERSV
jgi:hypothetical protein